MSGDPAQLHQRVRNFVTAFSAYDLWDPDYPEPHAQPPAPWAELAELVALGEHAAPAIAMFTDAGASPHLRWWAAAGLGDLGPLAGRLGLRALESLLKEKALASRAAESIECVKPERFWKLRLYQDPKAVQALMARHRKAGTADVFLERALSVKPPALAAFQDLGVVRSDEPALLAVLRKAMMHRSAEVRGLAAEVLARTPNGAPAEALIEAMATAERVSVLERVSWHPESQILVDLLVRQQQMTPLMELLERRRCAGLSTRAGPLRAAIKKQLRTRSMAAAREAFAAGCCALELGDAALIPSLVNVIAPRSSGYAIDGATAALRHFGPAAISALEAKKVGADPDRARLLSTVLEQVPIAPLRLEDADAQFIKGSIDHDRACAFNGYSQVLRARPSAHAAFQLAWIDRAFGVPITQTRLAWIRSLGVRDEALLSELATPVVPLEGLRSEWEKCEASDAPRAAAAGLPGLGSKFTEAAKVHVERVRAACTT